VSERTEGVVGICMYLRVLRYSVVCPTTVALFRFIHLVVSFSITLVDLTSNMILVLIIKNFNLLL